MKILLNIPFALSHSLLQPNVQLLLQSEKPSMINLKRNITAMWLTNLALSKIPAMIPALNAAQFKPISAGTDTNVLVTGEFSWIMSIHRDSKNVNNIDKNIHRSSYIHPHFPLIAPSYQQLYRRDISTPHLKYTTNSDDITRILQRKKYYYL